MTLDWSVTCSPCYTCPICCPWIYYSRIHPHSLALALNMKLCEVFVLSQSLLCLEDSFISDLVPGFHSFMRNAWMLSKVLGFFLPPNIYDCSFSAIPFCLCIDHGNKPYYHSASQIGNREHFKCLIFHVILDYPSGRTLMCLCISIF